jgi:hypothetical protein
MIWSSVSFARREEDTVSVASAEDDVTFVMVGDRKEAKEECSDSSYGSRKNASCAHNLSHQF